VGQLKLPVLGVATLGLAPFFLFFLILSVPINDESFLLFENWNSVL